MEYTNSPMVVYTKLSPNKSTPRKNATYNPSGKITKITPHYMAGNCSIETCGNIFAPTSRGASSNYGIGSDGRVGMYCEEKDRSWCSSSRENDYNAITIEVANTNNTTGEITAAAWESLIALCTDICKRNGIAQLIFTGDAKGNLTYHSMFAATSCPGKWLKDRFGLLAAEVNKRLGTVSGGTTTPVAPVEEKYTLIKDLKGYMNAADAIAGKNSTVTVKAGEYFIYKKASDAYNVTKAKGSAGSWINPKDNTAAAPAPAPAPAPSVSKLGVGDIVDFKGGKHYAKATATSATATMKAGKAKITDFSAGSAHPYHLIGSQAGAGSANSNVYGWVDANLVSKSGSVATSPAKKSNTEIAKEVVAGKWGNNPERKNKLIAAGYDYNAIQKIVNTLV